MEILYSVDAYHINSARLAAIAFANEYWAQPRKIKNFTLLASGNVSGAKFGVVNGTREYHVKYQPESRGVSTSRWNIVVTTPEAP